MPETRKYRTLEELGSGGMGRVFKGELVGQAGFRRPIVIKQLFEPGDAQQVRLLVEEARRYAVLDHENIGRIFDFEKVDGELCLIMEYIDGWTLTDYLDRHRALSLLAGVELSVFIASRVCRALEYVFETARIVHRDVSPSNIMTTREGAVKLIDFGIATRSGTRDSSLTGKPAYMAPEMIREMRADNRSDIFTLGAVLFELLSGERLFSGESVNDVLGQVLDGELPSPREYNDEIPDPVVDIVTRALQRNPAERFPSAGAMGVACEHFLYDKGYGPTNLTLKQRLQSLFPGAYEDVVDELEDDSFPEIDPGLLPIDSFFVESDPDPEEKTRNVARPIAEEGTDPPAEPTEEGAPRPRPHRG